ncbi:MAG: hypothetical protein HN611_12380, partial [Gemmatimonadetes bacterium]|nr:hypothetical protein [Gemmatimonadota bacterium]
HGALYTEQDGLAALDVRGGQIEVGSLQVPGLGVGVDMDVREMLALDEWTFASLA